MDAIGKQCMDLYNDYCDRVLGTKGMGADKAKNILKNTYAMKQFIRINNTPKFVPQKGDICIWNNGIFGHVAICYGEGNVNTFKTIDQNWTPLKLTDVWHNYLYMAPIVFLRPKNQANIVTPKPVTKQTYVVNTLLGLNIRAGAGTNFKKVGVYKNKTKIIVTQTSNNWGKTDKGWVALKYCKKI